MTRRGDWQARWGAYMRARADLPFAWGSNDCCLFAAGSVEALTGIECASRFGRYDSAMGAARKVEQFGGLMGLATAVLGPHCPPVMAAVGDVVLVENAGRDLLGVCNGTSCLLYTSPSPRD